MNELPAFAVRWVFRNDHEWHRDFPTVDERTLFINSVGLVSHPDIYTVTLSKDGQDHRDLKRVA